MVPTLALNFGCGVLSVALPAALFREEGYLLAAAVWALHAVRPSALDLQSRQTSGSPKYRLACNRS